MDEYEEKLAELKADYLDDSIPGGLFYEAMRQICETSDSCWRKSFDITEQYIQTLEEYVQALKEKLAEKDRP